MAYYIALAAITLCIVEVLALVGIWLRYAIPRAPEIFHVLLTVPMLTAAGSALCIGWIGLEPGDELWGLSLEVYELAHFSSQTATFGILIGYAIYHHLRGRHCPV